MTYLPSLIKEIDNFLHLAEAYSPLKRIAAGPEDEEFDEPEPDYSQYDDPRFQKVTKDEPPEEEGPGLYPNIKRRIDLIEKQNEDVSESLNLVALLYKKALGINGGFEQVLAKIKTAMSDIDLLLDDVESNDDIRDESDSILEDMASDLRQRSKETPPTQRANTQQAAQALLDVSKEFNAQEAAKEMASQKQKFEKGKPGAELGHLTGPQLSTETPEKYKKEIDSLEDGLQNDLSSRDPAIRPQIEKLIQTLKDLAVELIRVKDLQAELKITPDDIKKKEVVAAAVKNLDNLREERKRLKRVLNTFIKDQQIKEFRANANRPNIKPSEKLWWEQRAQLEELRKSTDLRKSDEIKAREKLINYTGVLDVHNDFMSQTTAPEKLQELVSQVQAGKAKRITRDKYDRELTEQRGKEQVRELVPSYEKTRGGRRVPMEQLPPEYQVNFEKAEYAALIKKLRDENNTAVSDARKYIMRPNEKGDPAFKPFIDAISAAIRKKDKTAQYQAVNQLKAELHQKITVSDSALKGYVQSIRLSPHFKKIESDLYDLKDKQGPGGVWNLSEEDKLLVKNILVDIYRIQNLYIKYYRATTSRKFQEQKLEFFKNNFSKVVSALEMLKMYIKKEMLKGEVGELTWGKRPTKTSSRSRMRLLKLAALLNHGANQ